MLLLGKMIENNNTDNELLKITIDSAVLVEKTMWRREAMDSGYGVGMVKG